MKDQIKVILPASLIPTDAIVTKITGTYRYKVSRKITIYPDKDTIPEVINAEDGNAFLISCNEPRADINCISSTTELVWLTTEDELYLWLSERVDRD